MVNECASRLDTVPVEALKMNGDSCTYNTLQWDFLLDLLDSQTLVGLAANQTEIPFLGWVEVEFWFGKNSVASETLLVPIIVSSDWSEHSRSAHNWLQCDRGSDRRWRWEASKAIHMHSFSRCFSCCSLWMWWLPPTVKFTQKNAMKRVGSKGRYRQYKFSSIFI